MTVPAEASRTRQIGSWYGKRMLNSVSTAMWSVLEIGFTPLVKPQSTEEMSLSEW